MTTLRVTNLKSRAANVPPKLADDSGAEIGRTCRAFASFNGNASPPTFFASFNVSSITDTAVGSYTVNYARALATQGCPVAISARSETLIGTPTTASVVVVTRLNDGTQADAGLVTVATFES